jgi:CRISPR-associated protein Csb3
VRLDKTNPCQFLACCGLLELADRLWGDVEGWFDQGAYFCLRSTHETSNWNAAKLINEIAQCPLDNTMTDSQRKRHEELSAMPRKAREANPALEAEKKQLDALHREAAVVLRDPFNLRLDWFLDERAEGKVFKTWAGQQSVVDIATKMQALIDLDRVSTEECLFRSTSGDCLPFNFDSDLGGAGSALDIGFSIDPLKDTGLRIRIRPLLEFAAFVGLQRFRPRRIGTENLYEFSAWSEPLFREVAVAVVCGSVECLRSRTLKFSLLYRTKYLKSFLPCR